MTMTLSTAQRPYVPPAIRSIGRLDELTLTTMKKFGWTDGYAYLGVSITNASA